MCGIFGVTGINNGLSIEKCSFALDLMAHRGPDDRGEYTNNHVFFGHRRLAILDLSSSGHQPMVDKETGITIVFNGEIYNYLEIRNQLIAIGYHFNSKTDTEVLLKAFMEWGPKCLDHFNGMWAFAIWQPKKNKIFVARDRFGVKPFYYFNDNKQFAFASEPKALLEIFPECRKVNPKVLYEFLELGMLYASDSSFYSGIEILPPAHCGEYDVDKGSFITWRYWAYPECPENHEAKSILVQEFKELLNDSVQLRLRSDVPVGITLSGGLDSTAVLSASMRGKKSKRVCFTSVYGDSGRGESKWAEIASKPYGIRPIEVDAPFADWINTLQQISWHMDAPGYSPAVFPLWSLMQKARNMNIPVLLEGQGADECLGGYPQYGILSFIDKLKDLCIRPTLNKIQNATNEWNGLSTTFTSKMAFLWLIRECFPWLIKWNRKRVGAGSTLKPEFIKKALKLGAREFRFPISNNMDTVTRRLLKDFSVTILPGLLHYGDAISMAHSIESRLPFMDYRLVEWLFSQSSDVKISSGETKWILRQYLRNSGQETIGNRPDKLGYPTPLDEWLSIDNGRVPKKYLLSHDSLIQEFCNPEQISRLI
ncbi:MAG: asparagine synthase (glutamine-hydrolyzing), partial [Bacteroidetes bacterium]|nr:asparagine synthase (glutamine-hydrolyzing) [Bacteroidota bacterium]